MKNIFKIIALILAVSVIFSLASCTGNQTPEVCTEHTDSDGDNICDVCDTKLEIKDDGPKKGNNIGDICHSYNLSLLLDDGTVNIEDYRGKVVVINFWGTWCNPCKSELPHFSEVSEEMADEVVVIAIHSVAAGRYNANVYDVTERLPNSKIIFAVDTIMGSKDVYSSLLGGGTSFPYTVIVDADGIITHKQIGAISKDTLKSRIDEAKN